MDRIFISTYFDGLGLVIGDKRFEKEINYLENNNLLYYSISKGKFQVDPIETNLFLVRDNSQLDLTINKANDYLIRHSTCSHSEKFDFINQDGMHEEGDLIYTKVFEIIFDDEKNGEEKASKIIKELFDKKRIEKLFRQKTDFLYSIYRGNRPDAILIPEIVKQTTGTKELLQYFNDNPFNKEPKTELEQFKSKEQIVKFNELRIVLGIK